MELLEDPFDEDPFEVEPLLPLTGDDDPTEARFAAVGGCGGVAPFGSTATVMISSLLKRTLEGAFTSVGLLASSDGQT